MATPSMVKRDELAPARTAIRLRVMGMIGHDNGSAGDQPGRNNSPENYVLHGWNPPLTPPHVKRRIAPKRWRSSLVPCTDKIGHRSDRRCRRWSGRCEPRNVDRTTGLRPTRWRIDRCRVAMIRTLFRCRNLFDYPSFRVPAFRAIVKAIITSSLV